ncbi:MAG: tetratricopeptide repeat protein, partial [Candidatus Binataceae bacterium]
MFTQCVKNDPEAVFCHDRLGMALEARGERSAARSQLEQAVALAPDNGMYRYDLGLVDESAGGWSAAERAMAAGLALMNRPPASAYARLAIVADAAGDAAGADAALARAEKLPGGAAMAAIVRAQILRRHGDLAGSARALDAILARDPNNPQALAAFAMTLAAEGRPTDALAAYRHASAILPREPALHYRVASILHRLGRDREARAECAAALAAAPNDPAALALMHEIEPRPDQ